MTHRWKYCNNYITWYILYRTIFVYLRITVTLQHSVYKTHLHLYRSSDCMVSRTFRFCWKLVVYILFDLILFLDLLNNLSYIMTHLRKTDARTYRDISLLLLFFNFVTYRFTIKILLKMTFLKWSRVLILKVYYLLNYTNFFSQMTHMLWGNIFKSLLVHTARRFFIANFNLGQRWS